MQSEGKGGCVENQVAKQVVDAALSVHRGIGPGLLESVYETALSYELTRRGLPGPEASACNLHLRWTTLRRGFSDRPACRDSVIVEITSVDTIHPVHKKQLLTYLRLGGKRLGLLINFNCGLLRDGVTRIVNGLPEAS
jgi:GxxExxY protein